MTSPLRILVVDDDKDHADSLADLFTLEGHTVSVAYSAQQAIDCYIKSDFDVAFIDVVMPGMNGVESFLEIRRLRPDAKIFMMTGYSVEELLRQAVDNGALGVIPKPFDPDAIMARLEEINTAGIVIVAEDDPEFASALSKNNSGKGKVCAHVTDPAAAVKNGDNQYFDVMVLDLKSSSLINGLDVYTSLRTQGKAVPTVMITACPPDFEGSLETFRDFTSTGILNKPFEPCELIGRLYQIRDTGS